MLGMAVGSVSYAEDVGETPDGQRAQKRHRARHTKSRNGCFSCKLRRVKCDETRPACGACASRGEPCSFPDPPVVAHRTTSSSRTRREGPRTGSSCHIDHLQPYLEPLEIDQARSAEIPHRVNDDLLGMDNLLLLQFFHLHTGQEMSLHPKRTQVWRRVIPDLAGKNRYLMHLLLALGGIHKITNRLRHGSNADDDRSEIVDLQVVMEHHHQGLQDFTGEVAQISNSNAVAVYTGSLLLVGFIYASLQVPELNPPGITADLSSIPRDQAQNRQSPWTTHGLQLSWLHLIRGVSSVIQDQWPALKASRLRPMVLYFHGDEYWKDLPFTSSLSRLNNCAPRLRVFAQGASQAIADLKASWAAARHINTSVSGSVDSPNSLPSSTTSDWDVNEQSRAIDQLEMAYSRIICILQCSVSECGSPRDFDIQADFEEAAVLSWPTLISDDFISLLDDPVDPISGYCLVILAHFYVINTLVDRWFLNGSFEGEIFKICESVHSLCNVQLDQLLVWPMKVANS